MCCSISIVPGFNPSILHFESGLHLEVDVLYRVIRTRTVLIELRELWERHRHIAEEYERAALNALVKTIIMTRYRAFLFEIKVIILVDSWLYWSILCVAIFLTGLFVCHFSYNNKTYRIDDIDFATSPRSTFRRQDGSEITYLQYFSQVSTFY